MEKHTVFEQYLSRLENIKEDMGPSDFRFYNIAHLPLLLKHTLDKSESCGICKTNIDNIEEIIRLIPTESTSVENRKLFESKKNKIEKHLKKEHKMKLPGYYASLGSLLGILISAIVGIIITLSKNLSLFNDIIIIVLALGLILGRGLGLLLDKNIFRKNLQL
jgi:hypothetical protein